MDKLFIKSELENLFQILGLTCSVTFRTSEMSLLNLSPEYREEAIWKKLNLLIAHILANKEVYKEIVSKGSVKHIAIGSTPVRCRGLYDSHTKTVHLEGLDVGIFAHEMGHALDWDCVAGRFNSNPNDEFKRTWCKRPEEIFAIQFAWKMTGKWDMSNVR